MHHNGTFQCECVILPALGISQSSFSKINFGNPYTMKDRLYFETGPMDLKVMLFTL